MNGGCADLPAYVTPTISASQFVDGRMRGLNRKVEIVVRWESYGLGIGTVGLGGRILLRNPAVQEFVCPGGSHYL